MLFDFTTIPISSEKWKLMRQMSEKNERWHVKCPESALLSIPQRSRWLDFDSYELEVTDTLTGNHLDWKSLRHTVGHFVPSCEEPFMVRQEVGRAHLLWVCVWAKSTWRWDFIYTLIEDNVFNMDFNISATYFPLSKMTWCMIVYLSMKGILLLHICTVKPCEVNLWFCADGLTLL